MENVNEVLEMLDRESIDQDQAQKYQESKRFEAVDTTSRESNDQVFFSESEQGPIYVIAPELYWDEEIEFAVEISKDNEEISKDCL